MVMIAVDDDYWKKAAIEYLGRHVRYQRLPLIFAVSSSCDDGRSAAAAGAVLRKHARCMA